MRMLFHPCAGLFERMKEWDGATEQASDVKPYPLSDV